MLMRNPECHVQVEVENKRWLDETFIVQSPREMFLGQVVLMLLLVVAILFRSLA